MLFKQYISIILHLSWNSSFSNIIVLMNHSRASSNTEYKASCECYITVYDWKDNEMVPGYPIQLKFNKIL